MEARHCPAAPVIEMTAFAVAGDTVQIHGTVHDEHPQDCLVNLGGVTANIALVNADGTFDVVTVRPGAGQITGTAVDQDGLVSQQARAVVNAAPSITEFYVSDQNGVWVITGRVVDESPDACTVRITSSIAGLNNLTLHPAEGGYFSHSWTPPAGFKGAAIRVVATDSLGLTSQPIDDWVG